jgi:hypothetical protein
MVGTVYDPALAEPPAIAPPPPPEYEIPDPYDDGYGNGGYRY